MNKGKLIYRMDDLDPDRCTSEYAQACIDDMRSMGLEWDEGPDVGGPVSPYSQSKRGVLYFDALKALYELDLVYPCNKSRKEIRSLDLWIQAVSNFLQNTFANLQEGHSPKIFG